MFCCFEPRWRHECNLRHPISPTHMPNGLSSNNNSGKLCFYAFLDLNKMDIANKYHAWLKKTEWTLETLNFLAMQATAKSFTFLKFWMIQLSKYVCSFSVASTSQKLEAHMCIEVASLPRGFDNFENTYGPVMPM